MKQISFQSAILFLLFIAWVHSFQGCDDSSVQDSGDHINGYVTFTDTSLIGGGYYAISMYKNRANPFDTLPLRSDSLTLSKDGNRYKSFFKFSGVSSGQYYFGVTWIKYPVNPALKPPVLGTRGCDTNHNCNSHILISFPNYSYEDCNILSWTDTTKKLN
jgi:hypothetical protein